MELIGVVQPPAAVDGLQHLPVGRMFTKTVSEQTMHAGDRQLGPGMGKLADKVNVVFEATSGAQRRAHARRALRVDGRVSNQRVRAVAQPFANGIVALSRKSRLSFG